MSLPSLDQLGHAFGTSLNWAGAAIGMPLLVQAGSEAAAAPTSAVYLAIIGIGGILTTLAKLFYDDRKLARDSRIAELRDDYAAVLTQVSELKADLAKTKTLAEELAAALWVDRRWMIDVAARHGERLPDGFGERPFDRPASPLHPTEARDDDRDSKSQVAS